MATVNAIIEAAARILSEQGWQGLNTNAVARRAGVSVGSVYEYFPDKQAILDVIIDRHLSKAGALIREAASVWSGPMRADMIVDLLVAGFISLHRDDPRLHRVLSSEVPVSPAQRGRIEALRSDAVAAVTAALSGQVSQPELKAAILVDTADALAHRWIVDAGGAPVPADIMSGELAKMLKTYVKL